MRSDLEDKRLIQIHSERFTDHLEAFLEPNNKRGNKISKNTNL